jgi:hypothetical protein
MTGEMGPGKYTLPSRVIEGPKFSMGAINYNSKKIENTSISPGPGMYKLSLSQYKSYSYSMGLKTDLGKNKSTSNIPAPNHYNPNHLFKSEGNTKFGKGER